MDDDRHERSRSEDGKQLLIKLKLPKPEAPLSPPSGNKSSEGSSPKLSDHDRQQQEEEEMKFCSLCNKGFSSGRALGGHMRVHVQAHPIPNKKLHQPKKLKKENNDQIHVLGGAAADCNHSQEKREKGAITPVCPVCDKAFSSQKSLFGHMRCHPERSWRGINPPPGYSAAVAEAEAAAAHIHKNSSSSTLSSDSLHTEQEDHHPVPIANLATTTATATATEVGIIDLSKALRGKGWSKTDLRGRKAGESLSTSSGREWEMRMEEEEAVHELLLLAQNGFGEKKPSLPGHPPAIESANSLTNKVVVVAPMGFDDYYEETSSKKRLRPMGLDNKSNKKKKMRDLEGLMNVIVAAVPPAMDEQQEGHHHHQSDDVGERFRCRSCDKTFPSHQALGGHRSSHNKQQQQLHHQEPPFDLKNTHDFVGGGSAGYKYYLEHILQQQQQQQRQQQQHVCRMCDKEFATGQALGGHMRCHYTPSEVAAAVPRLSPTVVVGSSSSWSIQSQQSERLVFDFDLNELAPTEGDEEEEAPLLVAA